MGKAPARVCPGPGCAAAPSSWGPGTGLRGEPTWASVQAGKALRSELPTHTTWDRKSKAPTAVSSPAAPWSSLHVSM